MRILSIYAPLLRIPRIPTSTTYLRPAALLVKQYHSAEYSGGGLMGRDNFTNPLPTPPTKGPEEPFAHLESSHLMDPRSVRHESFSPLENDSTHFLITIDCEIPRHVCYWSRES